MRSEILFYGDVSTVTYDVNVIFDFIYDNIHVLNHQMKILEVYRLWKYTRIVVLLLFTI